MTALKECDRIGDRIGDSEVGDPVGAWPWCCLFQLNWAGQGACQPETLTIRAEQG